MTSEELAERLIEFAARVGKVVDALPDTRMGRHVGGQLVRSATSPAPNYEEACRALYAGDAGRFDALVSRWPKDIRDYVSRKSHEACAAERADA